MSLDSRSAAGSRVAVILGVLLLLVFTFAFGLRLFWLGGETALPELLQDLPDSRTEADQQVFLARLRNAFPAGAPQSEVTAALRRQGFKIAAPAERAATYDRQAGVHDKCRRSGNVRWSVDAEGRVTELSGGYYQHCP